MASKPKLYVVDADQNDILEVGSPCFQCGEDIEVYDETEEGTWAWCACSQPWQLRDMIVRTEPEARAWVRQSDKED